MSELVINDFIRKFETIVIWLPLRRHQVGSTIVYKFDGSSTAYEVSDLWDKRINKGEPLIVDGLKFFVHTTNIYTELRVLMISHTSNQGWATPWAEGNKWVWLDVPEFILDPVKIIEQKDLLRSTKQKFNVPVLSNLYRRALRRGTTKNDLIIQARTLVNTEQFTMSSVSDRYDLNVAQAKDCVDLVWALSQGEDRMFSLLVSDSISGDLRTAGIKFLSELMHKYIPTHSMTDILIDNVPREMQVSIVKAFITFMKKMQALRLPEIRETKRYKLVEHNDFENSSLPIFDRLTKRLQDMTAKTDAASARKVLAYNGSCVNCRVNPDIKNLIKLYRIELLRIDDKSTLNQNVQVVCLKHCRHNYKNRLIVDDLYIHPFTISTSAYAGPVMSADKHDATVVNLDEFDYPLALRDATVTLGGDKIINTSTIWHSKRCKFFTSDREVYCDKAGSLNELWNAMGDTKINMPQIAPEVIDYAEIGRNVVTFRNLANSVHDTVYELGGTVRVPNRLYKYYTGNTIAQDRVPSKAKIADIIIPIGNGKGLIAELMNMLGVESFLDRSMIYHRSLTVRFANVFTKKRDYILASNMPEGNHSIILICGDVNPCFGNDDSYYHNLTRYEADVASFLETECNVKYAMWKDYRDLSEIFYALFGKHIDLEYATCKCGQWLTKPVGLHTVLCNYICRSCRTQYHNLTPIYKSGKIYDYEPTGEYASYINWQSPDRLPSNAVTEMLQEVSRRLDEEHLDMSGSADTSSSDAESARTLRPTSPVGGRGQFLDDSYDQEISSDGIVYTRHGWYVAESNRTMNMPPWNISGAKPGFETAVMGMYIRGQYVNGVNEMVKIHFYNRLNYKLIPQPLYDAVETGLGDIETITIDTAEGSNTYSLGRGMHIEHTQFPVVNARIEDVVPDNCCKSDDVWVYVCHRCLLYIVWPMQLYAGTCRLGHTLSVIVCPLGRLRSEILVAPKELKAAPICEDSNEYKLLRHLMNLKAKSDETKRDRSARGDSTEATQQKAIAQEDGPAQAKEVPMPQTKTPTLQSRLGVSDEEWANITSQVAQISNKRVKIGETIEVEVEDSLDAKSESNRQNILNEIESIQNRWPHAFDGSHSSDYVLSLSTAELKDMKNSMMNAVASFIGKNFAWTSRNAAEMTDRFTEVRDRTRFTTWDEITSAPYRGLETKTFNVIEHGKSTFGEVMNWITKELPGGWLFVRPSYEWYSWSVEDHLRLKNHDYSATWSDLLSDHVKTDKTVINCGVFRLTTSHFEYTTLGDYTMLFSIMYLAHAVKVNPTFLSKVPAGIRATEITFVHLSCCSNDFIAEDAGQLELFNSLIPHKIRTWKYMFDKEKTKHSSSSRYLELGYNKDHPPYEIFGSQRICVQFGLSHDNVYSWGWTASPFCPIRPYLCSVTHGFPYATSPIPIDTVSALLGTKKWNRHFTSWPGLQSRDFNFNISARHNENLLQCKNTYWMAKNSHCKDHESANRVFTRVQDTGVSYGSRRPNCFHQMPSMTDKTFTCEYETKLNTIYDMVVDDITYLPPNIPVLNTANQWATSLHIPMFVGNAKGPLQAWFKTYTAFNYETGPPLKKYLDCEINTIEKEVVYLKPLRSTKIYNVRITEKDGEFVVDMGRNRDQSLVRTRLDWNEWPRLDLSLDPNSNENVIGNVVVDHPQFNIAPFPWMKDYTHLTEASPENENKYNSVENIWYRELKYEKAFDVKVRQQLQDSGMHPRAREEMEKLVVERLYPYQHNYDPNGGAGVEVVESLANKDNKYGMHMNNTPEAWAEMSDLVYSDLDAAGFYSDMRDKLNEFSFEYHRRIPAALATTDDRHIHELKYLNGSSDSIKYFSVAALFASGIMERSDESNDAKIALEIEAFNRLIARGRAHHVSHKQITPQKKIHLGGRLSDTTYVNLNQESDSELNHSMKSFMDESDGSSWISKFSDVNVRIDTEIERVTADQTDPFYMMFNSGQMSKPDTKWEDAIMNRQKLARKKLAYFTNPLTPGRFSLCRDLTENRTVHMVHRRYTTPPELEIEIIKSLARALHRLKSLNINESEVIHVYALHEGVAERYPGVGKGIHLAFTTNPEKYATRGFTCVKIEHEPGRHGAGLRFLPLLAYPNNVIVSKGGRVNTHGIFAEHIIAKLLDDGKVPPKGKQTVALAWYNVGPYMDGMMFNGLNDALIDAILCNIAYGAIYGIDEANLNWFDIHEAYVISSSPYGYSNMARNPGYEQWIASTKIRDCRSVLKSIPNLPIELAIESAYHMAPYMSLAWMFDHFSFMKHTRAASTDMPTQDSQVTEILKLNGIAINTMETGALTTTDLIVRTQRAQQIQQNILAAKTKVDIKTLHKYVEEIISNKLDILKSKQVKELGSLEGIASLKSGKAVNYLATLQSYDMIDALNYISRAPKLSIGGIEPDITLWPKEGTDEVFIEVNWAGKRLMIESDEFAQQLIHDIYSLNKTGITNNLALLAAIGVVEHDHKSLAGTADILSAVYRGQIPIPRIEEIKPVAAPAIPTIVVEQDEAKLIEAPSDVSMSLPEATTSTTITSEPEHSGLEVKDRAELPVIEMISRPVTPTGKKKSIVKTIKKAFKSKVTPTEVVRKPILGSSEVASRPFTFVAKTIMKLDSKMSFKKLSNADSITIDTPDQSWGGEISWSRNRSLVTQLIMALRKRLAEEDDTMLTTGPCMLMVPTSHGLVLNPNSEQAMSTDGMSIDVNRLVDILMDTEEYEHQSHLVVDLDVLVMYPIFDSTYITYEDGVLATIVENGYWRVASDGWYSKGSFKYNSYVVIYDPRVVSNCVELCIKWELINKYPHVNHALLLNLCDFKPLMTIDAVHRAIDVLGVNAAIDADGVCTYIDNGPGPYISLRINTNMYDGSQHCTVVAFDSLTKTERETNDVTVPRTALDILDKVQQELVMVLNMASRRDVHDHMFDGMDTMFVKSSLLGLSRRLLGHISKTLTRVSRVCDISGVDTETEGLKRLYGTNHTNSVILHVNNNFTVNLAVKYLVGDTWYLVHTGQTIVSDYSTSVYTLGQISKMGESTVRPVILSKTANAGFLRPVDKSYCVRNSLPFASCPVNPSLPSVIITQFTNRNHHDLRERDIVIEKTNDHIIIPGVPDDMKSVIVESLRRSGPLRLTLIDCRPVVDWVGQVGNMKEYVLMLQELGVTYSTDHLTEWEKTGWVEVENAIVPAHDPPGILAVTESLQMVGSVLNATIQSLSDSDYLPYYQENESYDVKIQELTYPNPAGASFAMITDFQYWHLPALNRSVWISQVGFGYMDYIQTEVEAAPIKDDVLDHYNRREDMSKPKPKPSIGKLDHYITEEIDALGSINNLIYHDNSDTMLIVNDLNNRENNIVMYGMSTTTDPINGEAFTLPVAPKTMNYWDDETALVDGEIELPYDQINLQSRENVIGLAEVRKTVLKEYPSHAQPAYSKRAYAGIQAVSDLFGKKITLRTVEHDPHEDALEFARTYTIKGGLESLPAVGLDTEAIKQWLAERPDFVNVSADLHEVLSGGMDVAGLDKVNVHMKLESRLKDSLIGLLSNGVEMYGDIGMPSTIEDQRVRLIVWQRKGITAIFAAFFKTLKDHLKRVMIPNVVYVDGETPQQISARLNNIDGDVYFAEDDLKKQDRQTDNTLIDTEMEIYKLLGGNPTIVDLWRNVHRNWRAKGVGVKFKGDASRHTGQATTALGNVIVNLTVKTRLVKQLGSSLKLMLVLGDDNIILCTAPITEEDISLNSARHFNMVSEPSVSRICGGFLRMVVYKGNHGKLECGPDLIRLRRRFEVLNGVAEANNENVEMRAMSYCMMLGNLRPVEELIKENNWPIRPSRWYDFQALVNALSHKYKVSPEHVEGEFNDLIKMMRERTLYDRTKTMFISKNF